jgi:glycosyltransferase involved in cell wall biosynthesis
MGGVHPRIGLVAYSNLNSGIGVFARELIDNLPIDSFLSVWSMKGQDHGWHPRTFYGHRSLSNQNIKDYLEAYTPEVILLIETPYNSSLYEIARRFGAKTANIVMHESFRTRGLWEACDLLICPSKNAIAKVQARNMPYAGLFLPIDVGPLPFRERRGHTFVLPIGYGWRNDRRQAAKVVSAFHRINDPSARLILYTQSRWPEGSVINDRRIEYREGNLPSPADIWEEGDIAILPHAYEGYGRTVLEAMSCGLPTLTTDADPMNLFQHDDRFLVTPRKRYIVPRYVLDTIFNEVCADDLNEKMEWLLQIDTPEFSLMARRQAEAQSWSSVIDYRSAWLEVLEELCG